LNVTPRDFELGCLDLSLEETREKYFCETFRKHALERIENHPAFLAAIGPTDGRNYLFIFFGILCCILTI
jgi:hypothetical protein